MEITENEFEDAFKCFITSDGHDFGFHSKTYAVAEYTCNDKTSYFKARNVSGKHTEVAVIDHLKSQLDEQKLDSSKVKIYISYSPCSSCSQKLIEFMDEVKKSKPGFEVELVFSGLYLIKRPSCKKNEECSDHILRINQKDHEDNVEGLKKLREKGVYLRTFEDQDWLNLRKGLDHRKQENESLQRDFDCILESCCNQYTSGAETQHFRLKTTLKSHAEKYVIDHFQDLLENQKLDSPKIKIYTSDAPCHEGCQKLLQLLETAKSDHNQNLKIEIVFSGLHCIKRPSCVKKDDCNFHLSQVSDKQHQENVDGLKKLHNTPGVHLRPFTDQDWLDLQRALWCPKTKDEKLKSDFEEIMKSTSTSEQIEQSSQCTTDTSLNPTQKSEPDEQMDVGLQKGEVPSTSKKQNEPDMHTTTESCASSDEDDKDGRTACKRKMEDSSNEEERREKKLKKHEEEEKGEDQEKEVSPQPPDSYDHPSILDQETVFRLRGGHNRVKYHLYRKLICCHPQSASVKMQSKRQRTSYRSVGSSRN